ncbi:MAG: AcrB/AcrD/AcrF family protein, partial [Hyphomonadaceae bacterium]
VRHFFLRTRPEMGDLQINLKPKDDRKRASHEIALQARAMLRNIPVPKGGSLIVVEVPPGPPVISTLLAEVYHKDGATRRQIADNLKALMAKIPYIVDIDDYYGTPRPKTVLIPNRAAMTSLGVNEGQVLQSISAAMNGISVGSLNRGNDREPLNIEISLPQENRDWNGALSAMPVAISQSATGARLVEIGEIVQANETQQNYPIFRRDGLQAEMVVADLAGKYEAPIYGIFDTNKAIANHNWGALPTPKISWHGQPKDENDATILWDGEWELQIAIGGFDTDSIDFNWDCFWPRNIWRAIYGDFHDWLYRPRGDNCAKFDFISGFHSQRKNPR